MVKLTNWWRIGRNLHSYVDISKSVADAIVLNKPVVALETTIITHGMPFPENKRVALQVEEIVRQQGAVAATIGVVDGRIKVGLDSNSLSALASPQTKKMKISKRDLPYALSQGLTGGTTVAATVFVSKIVGIDVFVTGGIGGVHRNVNESLDVSADLLELSRNAVLVVSAGVKSILDIGRTLEYLETCGVCVATYGEGAEFPAFFSRKSGFYTPYNVANEEEAAKLVLTSQQLCCENGILLAVPIPFHAALEDDRMENVIESAVAEAEQNNVSGKSVTPFLLDHIRKSTDGESLASNIVLIRNNAYIGSRIAVKLSEMKRHSESKTITGSTGDTTVDRSSNKIVCVGGAMLDILMYPKVEENVDRTADRIEHIADGIIMLTPGGVGRNMADAVGRLRLSQGEDASNTYFIGTVGNDGAGQLLLQSLDHVNREYAFIVEDHNSACYAAKLEAAESAKASVIQDATIHAALTPQKIYECENVIAESSLVVLDGNLSVSSTDAVLEICRRYKTTVWFEPTDWNVVTKPFSNPHGRGQVVDFISPNLRELQILVEHLTGRAGDEAVGNRSLEAILTEARDGAVRVLPYVPNIMVTLGKHGLVMVNQECATFYEMAEKHDTAHVYGVGDCMAAGYIVAFLNGLPEIQRVSVGMNAALQTVKSLQTIPKTLTYQLDVQNLPRHIRLPLRGQIKL